jgi:hypothetical protein
LETIPEEEQPVAPFEPSKVPWDVWVNKRSCSEDLNHWTTCQEVNLVVIHISLLSIALFSLAYLLFLNCIISYTSFRH